jgi:hypothetical protein
VEGEDICAIAEMLILCITNPLSKYSKAKIDSMLEKIAPTEVKKRKTARQLNLIFANYVKKKIAIVVLFIFKLHTAILYR